MQKSHVIIGAYNHLPEGTEESSFEETYQIAWRPFLSVLYRFPDIAAVLHYSGTVLRWLESRHPEFFMLLEEMVLRKQIELLGGGFFAPLLPLVPGPDRLGQIELLTTFIRRAFGKRPRGCWLADYAWEPGLAATLQTCGFDYSFLTERQFRLSGLHGAKLGEPAMTEDQGKILAIFPALDANESLPAPLPPLEALEALSARLGDLALYTLLYPGEAARSLWGASGLESPDVFFERSFAALQKESLSFETTTPSRYLKTARRYSRAYFQGCASARLLETSLSREEIEAAAQRKGARSEPARAYGSPAPFVGSVRRTLLRHEESHALYSKMQYVRILVGQLRGDKSRKKTAQEELWRGQCGDAYWPGRAGGIMRLQIRAAAYAALIEAEKTTRLRGSFVSGVIRADINFDGEKEILYQGSEMNAYVQLGGACLAELDSFKTRTNYVNVMGFEEGEPRRLCFRDRLCDTGRFGEDKGSFSDAPYALVDSDRPANVAALAREGWFESGNRRRALCLRKSYAFRKGSLTLDYEIENKDRVPAAFRLASEMNLAAGFEPALVSLCALRGHEESPLDPSRGCGALDATGLRITNLRHEERIEIRSDLSFALSHEPCYAEIEEGPCAPGGSRYQGCRLLLGWDLEIAPDSSQRLSLTLELRS